jgi:heptose I phosphotransferase
MTPVALGESGANSFLVTEALEGCTKLSELRFDEAHESQVSRPWTLVTSRAPLTLALSPEDGSEGTRTSRKVIAQVARVAKRMHGAGLHHQDFYLGHLLLPNGANGNDTVYVIDLGRVRKQQPLASRWIVKDLAQLNYSARHISLTDRLRFLREYLGRRIGPDDKRLLARIASKTASIARHSKKNSL